MTPLFMPPKDGTYIGDQLLVGAVAVQMPDGTERYTRNGNFEINANGILQTRTGLRLTDPT